MQKHELWKQRAKDAGLSFNAWAVAALDDQASLEAALDRTETAMREERARVVRKSKAQRKQEGLCDHQGYENRPFCYRCQTRL